MKVLVTLGQDTPAYATFELEVPEGTETEQLVELAKAEAVNRAGDLVFDPSYDFSGLRITCMMIDRQFIGEDIPLEACGWDLGLMAQNFLSGRVRGRDLLAEADRQGLTVDPAVRADLEALDSR